jgi:predicted alpha/beta-fold hydrolase
MNTFAPQSAAVAAAWPQPSPFVPRRVLRNGHLMTIFAWASRRRFVALPVAEARLIRVSDDTQVLAHCYWQPDRSACPTLVALHGLEGSSAVHYMRGLAAKSHAAGWNVVLLNQRNCGGTEHLTPGLYHSGLTGDPWAVMHTLQQSDALGDFAVVGYSLGGNLAAKLAGEAEDVGRGVSVRAVVAVCPTIDLDVCVRAIERRANIAYQFNFVRNLRSRMRRKAALWPGRYDLAPLDRIWTIRAFDDAYTAPHHGFGDAATYYHRASALRVIDRIRIPTLILTAADDPFVPVAQFSRPEVQDNPHLRIVVSPHGGHCGFVGPARDGDGYWAETEAVRFVSAITSPSDRAPAGM